MRWRLVASDRCRFSRSRLSSLSSRLILVDEEIRVVCVFIIILKFLIRRLLLELFSFLYDTLASLYSP